MLGILRSAHTAPHDPRLGSVLEAFRKSWLALGRRRYSRFQDDLDDVVQTALIKLVSPDKLATVRDAARLEAWARSLFIRSVLDLVRETRRHSRRTYVGAPGDDPEWALRESIPAEQPTPEDLAGYRERLAIVARVASRLEAARLRFGQDLPEKEIAKRQGVSRHCVAGQLKRTRKALRQAFQDAE